MGHFKEIEIGSMNIFFPHIGSDEGRKRVDKYKIMKYIYKIDATNIIHPLIPIPSVATKVQSTAFSFFPKSCLMNFYDFIKK